MTPGERLPRIHFPFRTSVQPVYSVQDPVNRHGGFCNMSVSDTGLPGGPGVRRTSACPATGLSSALLDFLRTTWRIKI